MSFKWAEGKLYHHHHHQSLNREDCWGTTDDFTTSFLHFPCSSLPSGTWRNSGLSISLTLSSQLFLCLWPARRQGRQRKLGGTHLLSKSPRTGSKKCANPSLSFAHQQKQLPECGVEKSSERLARVECQMRTSAPILAEGCCHLKSKVLSLSEYPEHPKAVFEAMA